MYIINVSNNVFHSLVEKENRKISDGEQRSNLKIDSNKIHGKRTRWFLVDFSISHARRLVIVRVNCVENCILLSIGWISRSRNSHCPILFSARNFRQLPRTFPPSFTFGFRWWSFCRGIFKWVQRKGKLILLDIHRTSRRPISTRTVARRKGRTRRRCRSCCEISHGSTTPLPPCDSLSRSCLWPPSCTVDRRYEQNRSWKKRVAPLLAIDIKTSILMIRVHENISSYLPFLYHFRSTCRFSSTTAISFFYRQNHRLLVVQNRVRPPDAIVRNTNHSDPRELRGVPFQVMVRPNLCHPAIGRQYLILLVLRTKNRQDLSRKIP